MRNPALVLVGLNLFLMSGSGQIGNPSADTKPAWMSTPKQLSSPQDDTVSPDIRTVRNSRFNIPLLPQPSSSDIANQPSTKSIRRYYEHSKLPNYPTAESDSVIVGYVKSFQPFLSEDHTLVYAEMTIEGEAVLKKSQAFASAGNRFTILQEGGTAELGNGRVLHTSAPSGSILLDSNKRYLLFLHAIRGTEAFSVLKAWDLTGEAPAELSYDGHYQSPANSIVSPGMSSEAALLEAVKNQLARE